MRTSLFLLLLLGISSGCCTYQRCVDKYSTGAYLQDHVVVDTLVVDTVIIPKRVTSFDLRLDSIPDKGVLQYAPTAGIKIKVSQKKGTSEIGQYQLEVACLPDTIIREVQVQTVADCPPRPMIEAPPPTLIGQFWDAFRTVTVILFFLYLAKQIIDILINRFSS